MNLTIFVFHQCGKRVQSKNAFCCIGQSTRDKRHGDPPSTKELEVDLLFITLDEQQTKNDKLILAETTSSSLERVVVSLCDIMSVVLCVLFVFGLSANITKVEVSQNTEDELVRAWSA